MVKTKPNQKIHVDKLQTALDKLSQLESKPVVELTLRESIYFLRDKLKSALKKGYSYEDLSTILEEQEILVSAATLKNYLTDISKKSSSRKKRSKFSSQISSRNVTSSKEELASGLSEVETNKLEKAKQKVNQESASLSETKQSSDSIQKKSAQGQSKSRTPTKTKTKVLSGSDDDLSSEFNQY